MPEGFVKFLVILIGAIFAIVGLGGVPMAVTSGNINSLIMYTVLLFGGIGILGWVYKE